MLYPQMAWKVRAWVVASLGLLIVLLCWRFMVKPHEIKRLQRETAGAARQLRVTFSSQIQDNLTEIGAVFSRFEPEAERVDAVVLDALDVQF